MPENKERVAKMSSSCNIATRQRHTTAHQYQPLPCDCRSSRSSRSRSSSQWRQSRAKQQHRHLLCVKDSSILLFVAAACALAAAAEAAVLPAASAVDLLAARAIPVQYCPDGGALESGLCYQRCKPGWKGLGCSCWQGGRSYPRGCGVRPLLCQSRSYRRLRLPDVQQRGPFSLVLTADPQLFRVAADVRDVATAYAYNARLVESVNDVARLQSWPWQAGGGAVQQPEALVLLGDLTESYQLDELDAFRQLYDPSMPAADGGREESALPAAKIQLPMWHMLGNHDLANNAVKSRMPRAQLAADTMRAVLTPGCDETTFSLFPRANVSSFDASSMSYSFDYGRWHFVVLQYSPRYSQVELSIASAMGWLAAELSAATAQGRQVVLLLHAHHELGLTSDPTFISLIRHSNVAAIFYGHVHIRPWGLTGLFPGTRVPMFNCGASWYHVHCFAEFSEGGFRVAALVHNASSQGRPEPRWFGTSVHALPKALRAKPVLQQLTFNPANGAGSRGLAGGHAATAMERDVDSAGAGGASALLTVVSEWESA